MAITFVEANNNGDSASGASIAATVGAVTSGNFIVGIVSWGSATTSDLTSVTDGTNTYTIRLATADAPDGQSAGMFYAYNVTGSPTTITANFGASVPYRSISVAVFSGVKTSADPINSTNFQGQLQATPGTGTDGAKSGAGNLTPTVNNCLIWAGSAMTGAGASGSSNFAAGTGFTEPANAENFVSGELDISSEYVIQTTAAAVNGTFTVAQNVSHITLMAIFEETAGAPPDPSRRFVTNRLRPRLFGPGRAR